MKNVQHVSDMQQALIDKIAKLVTPEQAEDLRNDIIQCGSDKYLRGVDYGKVMTIKQQPRIIKELIEANQNMAMEALQWRVTAQQFGKTEAVERVFGVPVDVIKFMCETFVHDLKELDNQMMASRNAVTAGVKRSLRTPEEDQPATEPHNVKPLAKSKK